MFPLQPLCACLSLGFSFLPLSSLFASPGLQICSQILNGASYRDQGGVAFRCRYGPRAELAPHLWACLLQIIGTIPLMPNPGPSSQGASGTQGLQVQSITPQLLTNAQGQIIATVIGNQILPVINTQGITLSPIKPGQQVKVPLLLTTFHLFGFNQWKVIFNSTNISIFRKQVSFTFYF